MKQVSKSAWQLVREIQGDKEARTHQRASSYAPMSGLFYHGQVIGKIVLRSYADR
jgi:hypothetical protein